MPSGYRYFRRRPKRSVAGERSDYYRWSSVGIRHRHEDFGTNSLDHSGLASLNLHFSMIEYCTVLSACGLVHISVHAFSMTSNLPTTYEAYFSHPALIHPTLHLRVDKSTATSSNNGSAHPPRCSLCTTLFMNDRLFVDPFELEDRWGPRIRGDEVEHGWNDATYNTETENRTSFARRKKTRIPDDLEQQNPDLASSIRWSLDPETPDLERPVRYQFKRKLQPPERTYDPRRSLDSPDYPYEAVLQLSQHFSHSTRKVGGSYEVDIPTHMRYQEPSTSDDAYRIVILGDIESPANHQKDLLLDVYWACDEDLTIQEQASNQLANNQAIKRLSLTAPSTDRPHEIALPTAIASHVGYVPPLTFLVVLISWLYISRALFQFWHRSRGAKGKVE